MDDSMIGACQGMKLLQTFMWDLECLPAKRTFRLDGCNVIGNSLFKKDSYYLDWSLALFF